MSTASKINDIDEWIGSDDWIAELVGCVNEDVPSELESRRAQIVSSIKNVELNKQDAQVFELHKLISTSSKEKKPSSSSSKSEQQLDSKLDDSEINNKRLSDEAMFNFAMGGEQNIFKECQRECKSNCNGQSKLYCVQKTTFEELYSIRTDFWGEEKKKMPNREQRKERSRKILTEAYNNDTKEFTFRIGTRKVCEFAYLRILGLITVASTNKPDQWLQIRNIIQHGKKEEILGINVPFAPKMEHAIVFIKWLADMFAEPGYFDCGSTADVENRPDVLMDQSSTEKTQPDIKYLPYDRGTEVFAEYENYFQLDEENLHPTEKCTCGISTFRAALASLTESIKLRSNRGGFDTCSICNNLNDILKNTKLKWSKDQLAVVLKIKRLHLRQQAAERQDASVRKLKAKTQYVGANPQYAYFEMDAYTEYKCLTPRLWQFRNTKGDTKRMGNRVVGVIVVCGPIETRFVYSLDDLVYGGANTMIEVLRQAFHDLGVLLSRLPNGGLLMPRHGSLQMDNCGENKNKYNMGYLTLVNLEGFFDTIQVNFLMVGHTHGPIDQYFSVLTNKLWDTSFVGSPMALQNLFGQCENPLVNRQIRVHYDYKTWLEPYLNKAIKYIALPHVFLISKELGISILQHKAFSTKPDFLPLKPQGINLILEKDKLIEASKSNNLVLEELGIFGGFDTLYKEIMGPGVTRESLIRNPDQRDKVGIFGDVITKLTETDGKAAVEAAIQMEFESDVGYLNSLDDTTTKKQTTITNFDRMSSATSALPVIIEEEQEVEAPKFDRFIPKSEQLKLYQEMLTKVGTVKTGYILMLDYTKVNDEWLKSSPKVYNYIQEEEVMEKLDIVEDEIQVAMNQVVKDPKKRKTKETIFSKIATIVNASSKVVKDVNGGQYLIQSNTIVNEQTKKEELRPFSYNQKCLLQKEVDFYIQNSTAKGVLENLDYYVKEEQKKPYELFPVTYFSEVQLEDQKKRQQNLDIESKEMEEKLKYQLGSKYSNPYFNQDNVSDAGNVLPHAQPATSKSDYICEVVGCSMTTNKRCQTKSCGRHLCTLHFPTGGHNGHRKLLFKPPVSNVMQQNTTSSVIATEILSENAQVLNDLEVETHLNDDNVTANSIVRVTTSSVCQVIECNGQALHRCCALDCRFTAICDLHYLEKHASHANQIHVNDNATVTVSKSKRTKR